MAKSSISNTQSIASHTMFDGSIGSGSVSSISVSDNTIYDSNLQIYTSCLSDYCDVKKTKFFIFLDRNYTSVGDVMKDINLGTYEFCSVFPITLIFSERLQKYFLVTKVKYFIDLIQLSLQKFQYKDTTVFVDNYIDTIDYQGKQIYNPYLKTLSDVEWMNNLRYTITPEKIRIVTRWSPTYQSTNGFVQEKPSCKKNILGIDTEYCFIEKYSDTYYYIFIPCYVIDRLFNPEFITHSNIVRSEVPS